MTDQEKEGEKPEAFNLRLTRVLDCLRVNMEPTELKQLAFLATRGMCKEKTKLEPFNDQLIRSLFNDPGVI